MGLLFCCVNKLCVLMFYFRWSILLSNLAHGDHSVFCISVFILFFLVQFIDVKCFDCVG